MGTRVTFGILGLGSTGRIPARHVTEAGHDVVAGVDVADESLAVQGAFDEIYRSSETESAVAVTEQCPDPRVVEP